MKIIEHRKDKEKWRRMKEECRRKKERKEVFERHLWDIDTFAKE